MRDYFDRSRHPTYGILFALPLLVLYELGATLMNHGQSDIVRNGADVAVRRMLSAAGVSSTLAVSAVLIAIGLLIVFREQRRAPVTLERSVFAWMLAESIGLALLFGTVVGGLTTAVMRRLPGVSLPGAEEALLSLSAQSALTLPQTLVLSLGAGLYEELVFRVVLVPILAGALLATGRVSRNGAWISAAVVASLLFSAAHYVGPFGDPLALGSFLFRFLAGVLFCAILVLRGFGIVTWTHALYDVFLALGRGG
jgi:membrane protease YdiL (CAAX protease family)